jgi:hypothetical protein
MPVLLVRADASRHYLVTLQEGETFLGRGEDCGVLLNHGSVSRRHAKIVVTPTGASIEDVESQNGVLVNGEKCAQRALRSRDKIGIGRFTLFFLGDGKDDRFFNGRYVAYFAPWKGSIPDAEDGHQSTMALSAADLRALQQTTTLLETARVVDLSDPRQFWYPETRPLTFGKAGMVQVEGLFTWGVIADVQWDGKRHVLRRKAWWGKVAHKGVTADMAPLRDGDEFVVGGSRLRYTTSDPERG